MNSDKIAEYALIVIIVALIAIVVAVVIGSFISLGVR